MPISLGYSSFARNTLQDTKDDIDGKESIHVEGFTVHNNNTSWSIKALEREQESASCSYAITLQNIKSMEILLLRLRDTVFY
jgi:hypothetical protein